MANLVGSRATVPLANVFVGEVAALAGPLAIISAGAYGRENKPFDLER